MLFHIRAEKLPEPVREYRFAKEYVGEGKGIRERLRKAGLQDWRFDFAFPDKLIALEVEGGIYSNGRHVRGKGFDDDVKKYGEAQYLGWTVIRVTSTSINNGSAIRWLKRAVGQ